MFPAFIWANNIESIVNNLFGVKIFNPFPSFTTSSASIDSSFSVDSYLFSDHTL